MKTITETNWLVYVLIHTAIGCLGPTDTVADLFTKEMGAGEPEADSATEAMMADSATEASTADSATEASMADSVTDGSTVDASNDSRDAFCQGRSTWITVPTRQSAASATKSVCIGEFVSQTFRYGICSCSDAHFSSDTMLADTVITTSAFDSSVGSCGQNTIPRSPLGVNDTLTVSGIVTLGGRVNVAGADGMVVSPGILSIQEDLKVNGPFNIIPTEITAGVVGGVTNVYGNAWFGGDVLGSGFLSIGGDLRQSDGAERSPSIMITSLGGQDVREPVSVPSPCACGDDELLDIAGIVEYAETNNHNQEARFNSRSLESISGDEIVELPCGRMFVSSINISGSLTLLVSGRSALFVGADVISTGTFLVQMEQDATLDLFVGGNLSLAGLQSVGQQSRPAKLRVYVDQRVDLSGLTTTFTGNFYAPRAEVAITGDMQTLCGAVFAGKFITSGTFNNIWYDISILQEGDNCEPISHSCNRCDDCPATYACIDGRCGACQSDADCCEPLVCSQGRCYTELL